MNEKFITHDSQMEFFRSPFGAVCCHEQLLLRLKIQDLDESSAVVLRLWQDGSGEEKIQMQRIEEQGEEQLYQIKFNAPSRPSIVWYYFIITIQDKVYYYGNDPDQLGGIGRLYETIPPAYQITVYKKGAVTPDWFKEGVMYQIFPDRFYNGLDQVLSPKANSVIHGSWNNNPYYIRDVDTGRIVYYDFFGGNLQGVITKLPYLKELGISVIYFNPIFSSPSNHRYDTGDYKTVDSMLGNNEIFAELCAKGKEHGIAVILDGVFSHTGSDSIYFNRDGNYPEVGAYQSKESPYYSWYRFDDYPNKYESWWGVDTLPNVEENEPSYIDFIIESKESVIRHWLLLGAKGWRLDVADELPDSFIQKIYKTMKETDQDSVLIGEVWEDASNKKSYGELRQYLQGEEMDSVMNYPFRKITLDFMLGAIDAYSVHRSFMSLAENYPIQNFYAMMNLIGSHDVPRILTLLGEAPPYETMTVAELARYRLPKEKRKLGIARLKMMVLWQMTFPGIPSVYYGDEAGLEGYKDPFNRGTYPWGQENSELLTWHKKMIALRNQYDVFKTGKWISIPGHQQVYAYIRTIRNGQDAFGKNKKDNTALVLLNQSCSPITVQLSVRPWCYGMMLDLLNDNQKIKVVNGVISVYLEPLEGKVLLQVETESFPRKAGVLMHPTSLPSAYGIGDLGTEVYEFIDFLYQSKQNLWQILPLNPVGYGHSPYQCLSAFAGNHWLISLSELVKEGLLAEEMIQDHPSFDQDRVEFDKVKEYKGKFLRIAFMNFKKYNTSSEYKKFVMDHNFWLLDYSLFMALKTNFKEEAWHRWPQEIAQRQQKAMEKYRLLLTNEIEYHKFLQFIFLKQWKKIKKYAAQHNVEIIGDIPIFVAHDSCDVWANQQLFDLDKEGSPQTVAGVPPDYFSETGQLWGNPHYKWQEMAKDDYQWWRQRIEALLKFVDYIRVDHFRGFEAFWEIPAKAETAVDGLWVKGPGSQFFSVLEKYFNKLPFIVEDLGVITSEVDDLKHEFNFPGIKVLQFALDYDEHRQRIDFTCEKNSVLYTGTHDNDTTQGWYEKILKDEPEFASCIKQFVQQQLGINDREIQSAEMSWKLVEFTYQSHANTLIIPMQDILCLGSQGRMNMPGTVGSNWDWRCRKESLTSELSHKLLELVEKYKR
ncbi:bifunctional glycogen debranching protein GlgX/4-alpha-glucanotransferase [Pelosinus sp. sgz500959]|uniref:bifunctional glycogen debranching protein GlgX/4-alpha-glucanotransferase n=1 Tax=Pelosinus sp. sgz500959 TaxID=3242472 RepID=UPI00366B4C32